MPRKRRKRSKPKTCPVKRGQQLYRGLSICEAIKATPGLSADEVHATLQNRWNLRTIRRDLHVLESLGWVKRTQQAGQPDAWEFVGIGVDFSQRKEANE
jgi:DeoR/GlpR family transcriptional regulator of sugar metabolism